MLPPRKSQQKTQYPKGTPKNKFLIMGEKLDHDKDESIVAADTVKSEHLAEGVRPIMACVGNEMEHMHQMSDINRIADSGLNVKFYYKHEASEKKGFRSSGIEAYVISPIDERPKFTKNLQNCTSIIAVGRESGSETEISFLTHQDSKEITGKAKDDFTKDLEEQLKDLKGKCQDKSVDVVIAGGQFREKDALKYQDSTAVLNATVQKMLGFEPLIISAPKTRGGDNIYFDTEKRRLFVVRPFAATYNDVFKPSQIDELKGKWEEEAKKDKL